MGFGGLWCRLHCVVMGYGFEGFRGSRCESSEWQCFSEWGFKGAGFWRQDSGVWFRELWHYRGSGPIGSSFDLAVLLSLGFEWFRA